MTRRRHAPRKRPIALSEVVRRQLDALSKPRAAATSVSLARNAKGNTQIEVSVAAAEGETLEHAAEHAQTVYDDLCHRYPLNVEA